MPRLRSSDIPPDAERRTRRATIGGLPVGVVLLLLGLLAAALCGTTTLPFSINWPWIALSIAGLLLAMPGYFGWAGRAWRFGIYVLLALGAAAGALWLQLGVEAPLVALGTVIALWDFGLLVRFLRNHPRLRRAV